MTEPRSLSENEIPRLIAFLDSQLRPNIDWSIAAEYPQVFRGMNSQNLRVITVNDRIVAHAAINYLLIKNTFGLFKVAAIGSVVTDPEFRNQGLSQKILANCLDAAKTENADFAILWTDLYDFYRKLDFELAGCEVSMVLEEEWEEPLAPGEKVVTGPQVSAEAVLRLYGHHTCASLRTADDIRRFLTIPNATVKTLWNAKNELLAYMVQGKGMDLNGYVHEWGGNVPDLLKLLAHGRKEFGKPLTVILPQHSQNLIRALRGRNVTENTGYLGMIRPVQLPNLFFKLKRRAHQIGLTDFQIGQQDGRFFIGAAKQLYEIADLKTLTRLMFGPIEESEVPAELAPLFPIPMWIWGWDSI